MQGMGVANPSQYEGYQGVPGDSFNLQTGGPQNPFGTTNYPYTPLPLSPAPAPWKYASNPDDGISYASLTTDPSGDNTYTLDDLAATGSITASSTVEVEPTANGITNVIVTPNSGELQDLTLSGTISPTVIVAGDTLSAVAANVPTILIGGDDFILQREWLQLAYLFVDIGNADSIITGGGATVDAFGNFTTIMNTGTACTDGIHSNGDSVIANGSTVDVDWAAASRQTATTTPSPPAPPPRSTRSATPTRSPARRTTR